jgi:tRNA U34 5-carboxymethylaminomethyl modifying enzyme MnmG/GidA
MFLNEYDVIVVQDMPVLSCSCCRKSGFKTLLVTMSLQNIAQMSCNPAMELQKDKLCEMHWVDTRIVSTELQSSSRC